jgi:hypothetical protein
MDQAITLGPTEIIEDRPFTNPDRITNDVNTIRFMVDQLHLFLENRQLYSGQTPPIIVHQPKRENWLYRLVIARPELLMQPRELTCVGFLGHRRVDANTELATEFDEILVDEIPEYPGLLSYSTMALVSGDYSNLVVFEKPSVKGEWSNSKAHDQAVRRLAPDYYLSIKLYNGRLPGGLFDSNSLRLTRVKYFDYQDTPMWRAVRVFSEE